MLGRASKRGFAPLFNFIPLSFEGEGDKGGEVEKGASLFPEPVLTTTNSAGLIFQKPVGQLASNLWLKEPFRQLYSRA